MADDAAKLTGLTQDVITKEGRPFGEVWKKLLEFTGEREPDESPDAQKRILLLSHGGKSSDISMLQWTLKENGLEMPKNFIFGDTYHIVRDMHRKRPVTNDKLPPSWKLDELATWMKIPVCGGQIHRAAFDAKLTWDVLFHTLDRYGDETLHPRQQLVGRFFDDEARMLLTETRSNDEISGGVLLV